MDKETVHRIKIKLKWASNYRRLYSDKLSIGDFSRCSDKCKKYGCSHNYATDKMRENPADFVHCQIAGLFALEIALKVVIDIERKALDSHDNVHGLINLWDAINKETQVYVATASGTEKSDIRIILDNLKSSYTAMRYIWSDSSRKPEKGIKHMPVTNNIVPIIDSLIMCAKEQLESCTLQ